ncbi:hypothetical protein B0H19DRAFT_1298109 [Mycena capillaripes]|nr:hypothetical protein B0H19DRAFT_1298109 [Mycena capillaripes]
MSLRRARSASTSSDSGRLSRRPRLQDEPAAQTLAAEPLIRDATFFKDGGDCYLRAQDLTLEIHRYYLTWGEASVFKDMYLLPLGDQLAQGSDDSDPIVLADDTVECFRAFLTIAYPEPLELQVAETRPDQLPTLIHCAHFSHKYNMTPLLMAALQPILQVADAHPALEPKIYGLLPELSKLCGAIKIDAETYQDGIRDAVQWGWAAHIRDQEFTTISQALDVAEI